MANYERRIIEQIRTLLGNLEGALLVADEKQLRESLLQNPKIWLHPTHPLYGRPSNIDNSIPKMNHADFEAAQEENEMPPIYEHITVRTVRKSGLLEHRFMFEGKQKSVHGYTKKECWQKREGIMSGKAKTKKDEKKQTYTLETWLLKYYKLFRENALNETNKKERERQISVIINALGKTPLAKLTTEAVQEFINSFNDRPNLRDKILVFLRSCLEKSVKLGYAKRNPCDELIVVKHKATSYPVIQLAQQRLLLNEIDVPKYKVLFLFCCCTGLRIGEALSAEIDFNNNIVYVMNEDTVTKKHRRQIPLITSRLPGLELLNDVAIAGAQTYFKRLFKRLKINAVVHSFRVTFISCCSYVGVNPKQIQEWAGHRRIETTMDTYAKLIRKDGTSPILEYIRELKTLVSD